MFLSRKSDSPLDFDLELVKKQSLENPVYYVQYAHARISSVARKAAERGVEAGSLESADLSLLSTPEDVRLLRLLARFPDAALDAARLLSPHLVCTYLTELAGALHRYYTAHQVLAAESAGLAAARLHLLAAVARVLRSGLALLGVEAPERMEPVRTEPEQ